LELELVLEEVWIWIEKIASIDLGKLEKTTAVEFLVPLDSTRVSLVPLTTHALMRPLLFSPAQPQTLQLAATSEIRRLGHRRLETAHTAVSQTTPTESHVDLANLRMTLTNGFPTTPSY
jgi:hypothetical protein